MRDWTPRDPHAELFVTTMPEHRWLAWQHLTDAPKPAIIRRWNPTPVEADNATNDQWSQGSD